MEWILVICTQAWSLCGHYREVPYQTEQQCYRAMDELYKRHGAKEFKYVTCEPRKQATLPKPVEAAASKPTASKPAPTAGEQG